MSFLNSNNSDYLSARLTKKGRKSIAEGNFVIKLEPEQIDMIPNDNIKISIIRENTYECAISNLHSIKTNKWHSFYTIDEKWINEHKEELYKLEKRIKIQLFANFF